MALRVSEVYLSVQGEGPRVGKRTVFVRFGGCNLRCPGWPCDTPYAIYPQLYRHEWARMENFQLVEEIEKVANYKRDTAICFTGGEPFIQKDSELALLYDNLWQNGYRTFECFSNGTVRYPEWATRELSFIMDWKLEGSGEDPWNKVRIDNLQNLASKDAVKFVIKSRNDFEQAMYLWDKYIQNIPADKQPRVYYGVVWGELENATLIKWVLENNLPWYLNLQTHNYVFDRNKRGI